MRSTVYSRFRGLTWDSLSIEELLGKLADYLLQSGFDDRFDMPGDLSDRNLQGLYDAIMDVLRRDDRSLFEPRSGEGEEGESESEISRLAKYLVQRLQREGYIRTGRPRAPVGGRGEQDQNLTRVRFEITDKTVDFLGYKALSHLLGPLGRSSFGRHDTRDLATGIESGGQTKAYEFGDVLNLDVSVTILNSVRREGLRTPMNLESPDLMVHQCEYQSSCATVLMLDCSHSMILYGEDRFTPAKKVALALAHLVRTQYPGDSLRVVLFHDSAEEIPLSRLSQAQVGPFYTNTCEGLRLAQRILARERKDMRQIIMITDGKPSAVTEEDGSIYRNAFGLDPRILGLTFREVNQCRRSKIAVSTFMLARDYDLVAFVRKVTEICQGKAYFTTTQTLGRYILMDYLRKKVERIH